MQVYSLGDLPNQTYNVKVLGNNINMLNDILSGKDGFARILSNAKRPMIIIGEQITCMKHADNIIHIIHKIAEKYNIVNKEYNGLNLLHKEASRVAALDLGLQPGEKGLSTEQQLEKAAGEQMDVIYLLNADNEVKDTDLSKCTVIYQGHHGDYGAQYADIILPGVTYTEKNATYVNMEGRSQHTYKAISASGDVMEDWKILYSILQLLNYNKTIHRLDDLRKEMSVINSELTKYGTVTHADWQAIEGSDKPLTSCKIASFTKNYYMDNSITRSSSLMAKCTKMSIEKERLDA